MAPKLNRRRALFVLGRIDEILFWERTTEQERDTRFVELGRYLCEVRAGQYWRVDNLTSFDEFLEKKFPESRRKAYYLMAIHEQLPRQTHRDLKDVGWTKAAELAKVARRDGQRFDCATWLHKAQELRLNPDAYRKLHMNVLARDGWRCQSCGTSESLQVHHIRSRSALGDDNAENLTTLCADCHDHLHLSYRLVHC